MEIGEIYWADVPFDDRPGSKVRPVLIVDDRADPTVLVLTSTSQYKANLELLHKVDFSAARNTRIRFAGLAGVSYFYRENLVELDPSRFERFVGKLNGLDLKIILNKLDR